MASGSVTQSRHNSAFMSYSVIHLLPPQVANQIAAGEVVERPASVVKELVENSIDAGATRIEVRIRKAGKKAIEVSDNGFGMSSADAEMALQRHATSKISSSEDLHHIASHGFRGEALPSIASVSRFRMTTTLEGESEGVEVLVNGGASVEVRPAAPRRGTAIEVQDLFLNTPARLNFMRADKTEEAAIIETVRALALANPGAGFVLEMDGRNRLDLPAGQDADARVLAIMGREFADNSISHATVYEGIQIAGHLGLPTYHYRDSTRMMFMVNGRVIRDKQLIAALRAGYRDVMFHDRYPVALIRIEMDPQDVDVNVHPAKREVRFRSPQSVRAAVVACVRAAIERMGQSVSSQPTAQALNAMRRSLPDSAPAGGRSFAGMPASSGFVSYRQGSSSSAEIQRTLFTAPSAAEPQSAYAADDALNLGVPLTQIHSCYILTQSEAGVVLVDQHAAHERITYEKLKRQLFEGAVASQPLLTPVSWTPGLNVAAWLHENAAELVHFGVEVAPAGDDAFLIRAVPAMLGREPPEELVAELVDACMLIGIEAEGNSRVLERWLGNRACKGSIKSGRTLAHEDQEALLREMEKTPNIAQCNHGRPTYVRLSLNDLDRLFGRTE